MSLHLQNQKSQIFDSPQIVKPTPHVTHYSQNYQQYQQYYLPSAQYSNYNNQPHLYKTANFGEGNIQNIQQSRFQHIDQKFNQISPDVPVIDKQPIQDVFITPTIRKTIKEQISPSSSDFQGKLEQFKLKHQGSMKDFEVFSPIQQKNNSNYDNENENHQQYPQNDYYQQFQKQVKQEPEKIQIKQNIPIINQDYANHQQYDQYNDQHQIQKYPKSEPERLISKRQQPVFNFDHEDHRTYIQNNDYYKFQLDEQEPQKPISEIQQFKGKIFGQPIYQNNKFPFQFDPNKSNNQVDIPHIIKLSSQTQQENQYQIKITPPRLEESKLKINQSQGHITYNPEEEEQNEIIRIYKNLQNHKLKDHSKNRQREDQNYEENYYRPQDNIYSDNKFHSIQNINQNSKTIPLVIEEKGFVDYQIKMSNLFTQQNEQLSYQQLQWERKMFMNQQQLNHQQEIQLSQFTQQIKSNMNILKQNYSTSKPIKDQEESNNKQKVLVQALNQNFEKINNYYKEWQLQMQNNQEQFNKQLKTQLNQVTDSFQQNLEQMKYHQQQHDINNQIYNNHQYQQIPQKQINLQSHKQIFIPDSIQNSQAFQTPQIPQTQYTVNEQQDKVYEMNRILGVQQNNLQQMQKKWDQQMIDNQNIWMRKLEINLDDLKSEIKESIIQEQHRSNQQMLLNQQTQYQNDQAITQDHFNQMKSASQQDIFNRRDLKPAQNNFNNKNETEQRRLVETQQIFKNDRIQSLYQEVPKQALKTKQQWRQNTNNRVQWKNDQLNESNSQSLQIIDQYTQNQDQSIESNLSKDYYNQKMQTDRLQGADEHSINKLQQTILQGNYKDSNPKLVHQQQADPLLRQLKVKYDILDEKMVHPTIAESKIGIQDQCQYIFCSNCEQFIKSAKSKQHSQTCPTIRKDYSKLMYSEVCQMFNQSTNKVDPSMKQQNLNQQNDNLKKTKHILDFEMKYKKDYTIQDYLLRQYSKCGQKVIQLISDCSKNQISELLIDLDKITQHILTNQTLNYSQVSIMFKQAQEFSQKKKNLLQ